MQIGHFELLSFVEQRFKLDGGSMYGVVPKSLWQKLTPADENNLIDMVTNLFVLRAHGKTVLFDAGFGDTLSERENRIYGLTQNSRLEDGLKGLGLTDADIDFVFLSHLHTDHVAGAVRAVGDELAPRYGNAVYLVSSQEWRDARQPNERTGAVYNGDRLAALQASGQVDFVDGDRQLLPGVEIVRTGGHTDGHLALEIESDGERAVYYADILPLRSLTKVAYIPATDIAPLRSMDAKRELLTAVVDTSTVVAFDHDPVMPLARLRSEGKHVVAEPAA